MLSVKEVYRGKRRGKQRDHTMSGCNHGASDTERQMMREAVETTNEKDTTKRQDLVKETQEESDRKTERLKKQHII